MRASIFVRWTACNENSNVCNKIRVGGGQMKNKENRTRKKKRRRKKDKKKRANNEGRVRNYGEKQKEKKINFPLFFVDFFSQIHFF